MVIVCVVMLVSWLLTCNGQNVSTRIRLVSRIMSTRCWSLPGARVGTSRDVAELLNRSKIDCRGEARQGEHKQDNQRRGCPGHAWLCSSRRGRNGGKRVEGSAGDVYGIESVDPCEIRGFPCRLSESPVSGV